jgi:hypothetical protein
MSQSGLKREFYVIATPYSRVFMRLEAPAPNSASCKAAWRFRPRRKYTTPANNEMTHTTATAKPIVDELLGDVAGVGFPNSSVGACVGLGVNVKYEL